MSFKIMRQRLALALCGLLLLNLFIAGFIAFGGNTVSTASAQTAQYKVLFDASHGETAGNADWIIGTSMPDPTAQKANPTVETDWTGAISAWGVALQKTGRYKLSSLASGGRITYGDTSNALDLKNFKVFVLPEPNTMFTAAEKTAIMNFVKNGGGLFMVADHKGADRNNDGADALTILNDLMTNNTVASGNPFGFKFDNITVQTDNPAGIPSSVSTHPVINGPFGRVTGSIIRSGTTATLSPSSNPNVKGMIYQTGFSTSGTTGVFFATSTFGTGRVAAWGDSSPVDDGTGQSGNTLYDGWNDPAGTNAPLALNATEWLAQGGGGTNPTPTPTTAGPTATPTTGPTATPTPTATSGTGTELIRNGGFESGSTNWTESSSGGYELVSTDRPRSGSNSAYMCDYNTCTESLYQTITVPSGATSATLTFYSYISSQETGTTAYDYLKLQIRNSSGTVLATPKTLSNASTKNAWVSSTVDLTSYKGQTIQIYFLATNGSSYPTAFYVDDVSVISR